MIGNLYDNKTFYLMTINLFKICACLIYNLLIYY